MPPTIIVRVWGSGGDAQETARCSWRKAKYASSGQFSARGLDELPRLDTLVTRHDTQDPVETQAVTGVAETHGSPEGEDEE